MSRSTAHPSRTEALWKAFLGKEAAPLAQGVREFFAGSRVLITGAGGSIGSAVARAVAAFSPAELVLVDTAEHGLYALEQQLAHTASSITTKLLLGSVADAAFIREVFAMRRPEIVFHAAALKHVPLVEANPIAAAETNVLGTEIVLRGAAAAHTRRLIHLSTDKAVEPMNVLGATKRVAEKMILANGTTTSMAALRLPNVLGSSGSVGPLFLDQIAQGAPLTVTDPEVTRFFLSEDETVAALVCGAASPAVGVLVPPVGPAHRIVDLAHFLLASQSRDDRTASLSIQFTGLRPGDKLHERMLYRDETSTPLQAGELYAIKSSATQQPGVLDEALAQLREAVSARDRGLLMDALRHALPDYIPAAAHVAPASRSARETFA